MRQTSAENSLEYILSQTTEAVTDAVTRGVEIDTLATAIGEYVRVRDYLGQIAHRLSRRNTTD